MKSITYVKFQFYIDGQPVPPETALKVGEKERAKLHYQLEAKKAEIEALRAQVAALEA